MAPVKNSALVIFQDPIDRFFQRYSQFDFDPHAEVWSEYQRMCAFFHWTEHSKKERKARHLFQTAIVAEFEVLYGADENKLDSLQRLCEKLDIDPIPQSITSCKKAIKRVHVNIMDFIDCERTGMPIYKFPSLNKLRQYTTSRKKFFPKNHAKESSLLRYLLRPIL